MRFSKQSAIIAPSYSSIAIATIAPDTIAGRGNSTGTSIQMRRENNLTPLELMYIPPYMHSPMNYEAHTKEAHTVGLTGIADHHSK